MVDRLRCTLFAALAASASLAPADDAPLWGEYASEGRGVQVAPRPEGLFEVVVYNGGLPGGGWDKKDPTRFEADAEEAGDLVADMRRVVRNSPTEGKQPPAGAKVLYGGPDDVGNWEGGKVVEDDLLFAGARSKEAFQDVSLHMEFWIPFQPERLGNYPGNSGVYLQDRYEIQILDDFGQEMRPNICGAVYRINEPAFNACYPPEQWQTYDIDFTAARYDAGGNKTANARMTVRQNGLLIHDNVEVTEVTGGHKLEESPAPGPIYLQYHSDPVLFRNVWVVPTDAETAAKRPRVPAFERYAAVSPAEESGGWLLSELSCRACHADLGTFAGRAAGPKLDGIGSRTRHDWLTDYLADPHGVKPGTTMPDVLASLPGGERRRAAESLTAFLSNGEAAPGDAPVRPYASVAGRTLYNEVGCGACHAPDADAGSTLATNVPLGPVRDKWDRDALAKFLEVPHDLRPSGRMPGMELTQDEAELLADFLLLPPVDEMPDSTLGVTVYHFSAQNFAEFDKDLAQNDPVGTPAVYEFSDDHGGRGNNFALRYEGTFKLPEAGEYAFRVGADDGIRILLDGQSVAVVDGAAPYRTAEGTAELAEGLHAVRVDYYQAGGGRKMTVEWKPPGQSEWSDFGPVLSGGESIGAAAGPATTASYPDDLVNAGRGYFASLGCANCHQYGDAKSSLTGPAIASFDAGCLAAEPTGKAPRYDLTVAQREALIAAVSSTTEPDAWDADRKSRHALASRNCYACHQRGTLGGPESARDGLFATTIPEMGDEGRLPPKLDHVGDKLKTPWLYGSIKDGVQIRDYVLTRMPVTKDKALADFLTQPLIDADRVDSPLPDLGEEPRKSHAAGRQLVGDAGLACIKCHSFGDYAGTGIQAVNLLQMTPRLREDWFHRYIIDPASLRPGTRMPSGFPGGKSVVPELYEGDPDKQTAAVWAYLSQGKDAAVPKGLLPDPIELVPDTEPILYRNFLTGVSPRGIAVGYPQEVHLAFDADLCSLRLLWTGAYLDAAKHWRGRGPGNQKPLGDNVVAYQDAPAVAVLESPDAEWPAEPDAKFRGYRLNKAGEPTFAYDVSGVSVSDFPKPAEGGGMFTRSVSVGSAAPAGTLVRALSGGVSRDGDWYVDGRGVRVRVLAGEPKVVGGELRILPPPDEDRTAVYELKW